MKLSDKTYTFLKWFCLIAMPAFITLITTLGTIFGHDMTAVAGTLTAITTFIGALIGVSNANYNKESGHGD